MVWQVFRNYLFSKRSTSVIRRIAWLCVLGVGIGVMAMVVVLSIMNGFDGAIRKRLLAVEPHLVVEFLSEATKDDETAVAEFLRSRRDLWFFPYESQDLLIRSAEGVYGGAVARGVEADGLRQMLENTKGLNQDVSQGDSELGVRPPLSVWELSQMEPNEAILGIDLAHGLGIFEGDEILAVTPASLLLPAGEVPPFDKIKVKKVLRTNVPETDATLLFYPRARGLSRLKDYAQVERGLEVYLKSPDRFEATKTEIEALRGVRVTSWKDRNSALFYSLKMEKLLIGTFLALSILIGSFSVLSALVLLVTQKRQDIGVFMSLGLSPHRTRWLFTRVGLLLSGIGVFGGLASGLFICWVLKTFPLVQLPDIYYDTTLPVRVDPILISGLVLGATVIAFLASWVPAWFSTRMSPSEALRGPVST